MKAHPKMKPAPNALPWYMASQFMWFMGMGIQFVAFQAIGTLMLGLSASQLGVAQATILAPSIIFMLPGGVAAERNDDRLLLIRLQIAAALPPLALALMVLTQQIDFNGLIIYGLLMGTIAAFIMPVRDTLLSYIVTPNEIQRAVTIATGIQFAGNLLGITVVALASTFSIGWVVALISALMMIAAGATYHLAYPFQPPQPTENHLISKRRTQIVEGLRYAFNDKKISAVIIMMLAMSLFYMGTFFVFFPIIIRDYYHGNVIDIAIINGLFWAGMMMASILLLRVGRIAHLGRLLVAAAIIGLACLLLLSFPAPFWWLSIICFLWGVGGGIFMSSSRTIIQSRAPEAYRGRLLSIYQLSFMGGAPIGALGFGLIADISPSIHLTPLVPMIGMMIILSIVCFFSDILSIKLEDHAETN